MKKISLTLAIVVAGFIANSHAQNYQFRDRNGFNAGSMSPSFNGGWQFRDQNGFY
jgi:hypothetical protein